MWKVCGWKGDQKKGESGDRGRVQVASSPDILAHEKPTALAYGLAVELDAIPRRSFGPTMSYLQGLFDRSLFGDHFPSKPGWIP